MVVFEIGDLDQARIIKSVLKFSVAALSAGLVVQLSKTLVWPFINMTKFWGVFTQGLVAGVAGLGTYFLLTYLFRSQEALDLIEVLKKNFLLVKAKGMEEIPDQSEVRGL